MNKNSWGRLAFLGVLLIGIVLINGCILKENTIPIEELEPQIENVSPEEAYNLIQENKNNPRLCNT